jgi:hypothetical protein
VHGCCKGIKTDGLTGLSIDVIQIFSIFGVVRRHGTSETLYYVIFDKESCGD